MKTLALSLLLLTVGCQATPTACPPNCPAATKIEPVTCGAKDPQCTPLVIDEPEQMRVELDEVMSHGIAVVAADGRSLRLLKDCHVPGSYLFRRLQHKEVAQQIRAADELGVNLPTMASMLGAKLAADFERGAALDVAWVTVGMRSTTWHEVAPGDLVGGEACTGATHFVRSAQVGAFHIKTGSRGQIRTVAEIFGAGGKAESSQSVDVDRYDGSLDSCTAYENGTEDTAAPRECGAPVRLEILAIRSAQDASKTAAKLGGDPSDSSCPQGYVVSDGLCARPDDGMIHDCKVGDIPDCEKQCARGSGPSCFRSGAAYAHGRAVAKNMEKASLDFSRGCDLGDAHGCAGLGFMQFQGDGIAKDMLAGGRATKRACDLGLSSACFDMGMRYTDGSLPKDPVLAATYNQKACDGGDEQGCVNLGFAYDVGLGVTQNKKRAIELFAQACDGGQTVGCSNLADALEKGNDIPADLPMAARLYKRSCDLGGSTGCIGLGAMFERGVPSGKAGLARDDKFARTLYEQAYGIDKNAVAAAILSQVYGEPRAIPDEGLQARLQAYRDACQAGDGRDCGFLGAIMAVVPQTQTDAAKFMQRGCELGDAWTCFEMSRLHLN